MTTIEAMNKKQIALTVVGMLIMAYLGITYNDDSRSSDILNRPSSAGSQFIVSFLIVIIIYTGLFFMLKTKKGGAK